MTIGFVTDTNILKLNDDKLFLNDNFLKGIDFYVEYINDLKKSKKSEKLIYFMPEIIIEELSNQKIEKFNIRYDSFEQKYSELSYGLMGAIPKNNIEEIVNQQKYNYMEKVTMLNLKYSKKLFQKLVNDSLQKKPPFDKSIDGKKTDAGFKDSLIWNTILESSEIDICNEFYYISGDNVFKEYEKELCDEFTKKHPKTVIKIINPKIDGSQRQQSLQKIIDDHSLIETDIVKLYNENLILKYVVQLEYSATNKISYVNEGRLYFLDTINFNKFTSEDINIDYVKKTNEKKYEVRVDFKSNKYTLKDNNDIEDRENIHGTIVLYFDKDNKNFKYTNYRIINVDFFDSYYYAIIGGISKKLSHLYGENYLPILDAFTKNIINKVDTKEILFPGISKLIQKNYELNTNYLDIINNINSHSLNNKLENEKNSLS